MSRRVLRGIGLLLLIFGLLTVALEGVSLSGQQKDLLPGDNGAAGSPAATYRWLVCGIVAFVSGGVLLLWGGQGKHDGMDS